MATLYERLFELCEKRGIKGAKMCRDLGISKSLMTDLKSGRKKGVNAETAQKLANYFGVSVGYLLGEEEQEKPAENSGLPNSIMELIEVVKTLSEEDAASLLAALKAKPKQ